jgi:hypothetical protein
MKAPHVQLFEDIAWSTATVAAQTRQRAHALGLPITELDPWYDVDDGPTLRRLFQELERGWGGGGLAPYAAPATAACIERLMLRDLSAAE